MSGILSKPGSKSGLIGGAGAIGYEELFTTILDFGNSSNGTGGFGESRSDQYVIRIGNFVQVSLKATLTHTGTTNGSTLIIRQLPFTPRANTQIWGSINRLSYTGGTGTNYTNGRFWAAGDPSTDAWPINSDVGPTGQSGTSTWKIGFSYFTSGF